ncbi:hypothetical protein Leryth_001085 [Lithospermum erythrorhizon]|nr:hypothetical protein Leryth_001085 [Lithospermum erythrorhizon]
MGSNFLGDLSLGNEKSSSTNNSCRKGKKGSSDRPNKQPQRGLGVAQLEKIRLHGQLGSSTCLPPSTHHLPFLSNLSQEDNIRPSFSYSSSSSFGFPIQQMGLSESGNIRYPQDYVQQHTPQSRWNHGNAILESPYLRQPSRTRHFLNQQEEGLLGRNQDKIDSMGISSQPSGSNGNQELDLELRLSL